MFRRMVAQWACGAGGDGKRRTMTQRERIMDGFEIWAIGHLLGPELTAQYEFRSTPRS